ncbi:MAG: 1-phosphofructokinase [Lachnospiraceae bacterium]|nr:1-phosphofructokinase [Lachnospiraceae bacterium]
MIYTVTFNPALDYIVFLDEMKLGDINRATRESIFYGGKGINVSTILNTLGLETTALGFVAGFTGKAIEEGLASMGMRTEFIHLPEGNSRINVKVKHGDETEINGQGPVITEEAIEELFAKLDALTEEDILILAGSIPNTLPEDIYEKILARLEKKGIRIAVDATKDLLLNVLKYHPFLIKPNNHELGEMFHTACKTKEDIEYYAKELQKMGARNVLISMAGDGAILITEEGETIQMGTPKGKVINSVGAGDSMVAGFVAGYLKNNSYEEALKTGTAAGSATAFSEGLASIEMIQAMMEQIEK